MGFSVIFLSGNQDWVQDMFAQDNRNKHISVLLLQSKHWGQGKSESIYLYIQSIQIYLGIGIFMKEKYSLCTGIHVEWMLLAYIIPRLSMMVAT